MTSGNDNDDDDKSRGKSAALNHPSRLLSARSKGFGIAAGFERPYRRSTPVSGAKPTERSTRDSTGVYGPLPPAGYYGAGDAAQFFERGKAGFADELSWYRAQYGETTSGSEKGKKKG